MVEHKKLSRPEFDRRFPPGERRRIAPGFWLDADDGLHVSVPELLALADLEDTAENRDVVARMAEAMLRRLRPDAPIIAHEPWRQ